MAAAVWKSRIKNFGRQETKQPNQPNSTSNLPWFVQGFPQLFPKFSHVAATIDNKLRKNQPVQFQSLTEAEKKEVEQLKSLLKNPPVLDLQRIDGHLTIDTTPWDT